MSHSHSNDNCPRVFIKRCDQYDREKILALVGQGMDALNFRPRGKVFVKPNVVFANKGGKYGNTAYTDTTFVGASLLALARQSEVTRIDMGENTAMGYPTRLSYKYAGYYQEVKEIRRLAQTPVKVFCIDEDRRDKVFVGGVVHDNIRLARRMARADCKVYLPKLKCHCVSTMTGAVKLNIGICSDDDRAIRHDFMLNDKIVDLLTVGTPDFIVMDAIDVGVGNEAVPTPRRLGLILMGTNPLAVDIVGARLLGNNLTDVPYLVRAVERGYRPEKIEDIELLGDITSIAEIDAAAQTLLPYDDAFYRWQDIEKELKRMSSPIRFYWGYINPMTQKKCETGCVMGAKMFFGFLERWAGEAAFKQAKPVVMVIGKIQETIDAMGQEAFLIGSCSKANVINARKVVKIDRCFTTAVEMTQIIRNRLGMPSPVFDPDQILPLLYHQLAASVRKMINLRYFQDMGHFITTGLLKKI